MSLHGSIKPMTLSREPAEDMLHWQTGILSYSITDSDKRIELPQASITCHDEKIICEIDALILCR